MNTAVHPETCSLGPDDAAHYRRRGYVVLRQLIGNRLIKAALEALSGLASGALNARDTTIAFEPGVERAGLAPEERQDKIRKFAHYGEDAPVLLRVAMLRNSMLCDSFSNGEGG